ncbi:hypothetical protein WPS_14570 [Vulcanimicrobium alpinum]|uniref:DsrE/DsrF-like family protein n=1 Tax=Vulcanimicrobium alpinum TaxID=3016050 RepID=A0AAN1XVI0_UNVUL|nr:hypothetical protein [Vulcanimicrobium alpinum]BDE06181.1 hypothetical protein WPS_14570 [Vulcanimicrobium alpinum]
MQHSTNRSGFARLLATGTATLAALAAPASGAATSKNHRIAFHVDRNEPAVMNLVLNNMSNAATYYAGTGELFEMELVAYGPGLHMLRADTSPVKDRLSSIKDSIAGVTFSACNVTKLGMEKVEGHPIAILPQARIVPAGVVRLTELQESGWSYIKP